MNKTSGRCVGKTTILALLTWLLFTGLNPVAEAASTLTLGQPVHFMASDGSDIMVNAGTYEVDTLVGSRLRLNTTSGTTLFLDAQATTHNEEIEAPLAVTVSGEDPDVVHVVLLLPNGQALDAPGSISGTRSRGFSSLLASTAQIQFAVTQQAPVVRDHRGQPQELAPPPTQPSLTVQGGVLSKYSIDSLTSSPDRFAPRAPIQEFKVVYRCPTCAGNERMAGVTVEIWHSVGTGQPRHVGVLFNVELKGKGGDCSQHMGHEIGQCLRISGGQFPGAEGTFIVKFIKGNAVASSSFPVMPTQLKIFVPTVRDHR